MAPPKPPAVGCRCRGSRSCEFALSALFLFAFLSLSFFAGHDRLVVVVIVRGLDDSLPCRVFGRDDLRAAFVFGRLQVALHGLEVDDDLLHLLGRGVLEPGALEDFVEVRDDLRSSLACKLNDLRDDGLHVLVRVERLQERHDRRVVRVDVVDRLEDARHRLHDVLGQPGARRKLEIQRTLKVTLLSLFTVTDTG